MLSRFPPAVQYVPVGYQFYTRCRVYVNPKVLCESQRPNTFLLPTPVPWVTSSLCIFAGGFVLNGVMSTVSLSNWLRAGRLCLESFFRYLPEDVT